MKNFLIKLLLILTPTLLVVSSYEFVMFNIGETYTIPYVYEKQKGNDSSLFLRKYLSQEFRNYKLYSLEKNMPDILSIGSSRMMQVRSIFFNESHYNTAGTLYSLEDLNSFLKKDFKSNTILIGIDPWWFKTDNIRKKRVKELEFAYVKEEFNLTRYNPLIEYHKILSDFFNNRTTKNIGANAQLYNTGFRTDGSLKLRDKRINLLLKEKKFIDTEEPKVSKRIEESITPFFTISDFNIKEFKNSMTLLKKISDKGKNVIVYLPPLTNESFKTLKNTENQKYMFEFITVQMPNILDSYNIKYIPTEHPSMYNLDDTYFTDGFHPSEVFIAIQLKKYHHFFNGKINPNLLEELIENRFCNLLFDKSEMITIYEE